MTTDDNHFMRLAIKEAEKAFEANEVPIGAIIVSQNQIISRGYNQTQLLNDATAHAEIIALTSAFAFLNSKYLKECTLYVTVEPCAMCAGALRWAQLRRIVFGAHEPKCGFSIYEPSILHPKTEIIGGIEEASCASLMTAFFKNKR
jgi:tRNA(adenine34) deaminase